MPFKGVEVDESFRPGSGGAGHLDEGLYLFSLQGIEASPKERDGHAYWEFKLRVQAGPSAVGSPWNPRLTWAPKAQFRLAGILEALGYDSSKLKGLKIAENEYAKFAALAKNFGDKNKNKVFGAYVAEGNPLDDGRTRSEIQEAFSEDEYKTRLAALESAPAGSSAGRSRANGKASATGNAKPQATDQEVEAAADDLLAGLNI